jgi:hypothetical protein
LSTFLHFLRVHLGGTLKPVVDQIQIPLRRRLAAKSRPIDVVIPGRGLLPASPESITTDGNDTESIGVMDSGLAQERAPE